MEDNKPLEIPSRPPEDCSAEHLRALRKRAHAALSTHRDRMTKLESQLTGKLDEISSSLAEQWATDTAEAQQVEQAYEDAQQIRKDFEQAQQAWQREQEEINAAFANRQQELDQQNAALDERGTQLDIRQRELGEREETITKSQEEVVRLHRDFEGQKAAWADERTALEAERTELQHKFELALDDVRRIRSRASELEQELARRPESEDDNDSAELIHLRAERDALAERIEELERQPATQIDTDGKHQMADLQRRFELAVEDVRELKTLNARLEARVAEAERNVGHKADTGGMDWESQKQRMLNSLSDEGDSDDPGTRKERATIEGTIRITDDVVAKKDDEIARLKEELSALRPGSADADADTESQVNQLLDADEVIQQHRKRLAQLEKEMEGKLRTAELELSIERAKLARKQVELNDWRAELETMQESRGKNEATSPGGPPKRRWLAKLGLGGDDEG